MLIYGRNAVREAIAGRRRVKEIWATDSTIKHEDWLSGHQPQPQKDYELTNMVDTDEHQGVVADVVDFIYAPAEKLFEAENPLIIVLDQIQNPHNLGAVCRTAECVGATGVVIPDRRSVDVTAAVCKASAGAVEHLTISKVVNIAEFLQQAKERGCWSYGAAADSRVRYDQADYSTDGVVLVLGAEGSGIRPRVASVCDQLVSIPMQGELDSLNVSVAGAVLMFEVARQRSFEV